MQDRAFIVTVRPSASDSIIPEVSPGMRMERRGNVGNEGNGEEGHRDDCSMGRESLGSSTMDCDGPS